MDYDLNLLGIYDKLQRKEIQVKGSVADVAATVRTCNYTANHNWFGNDFVSIFALDWDGAEAYEMQNITVQPIEDLPEIGFTHMNMIEVASIVVDEDEVFRINVSWSDVDNPLMGCWLKVESSHTEIIDSELESEWIVKHEDGVWKSTSTNE